MTMSWVGILNGEDWSRVEVLGATIVVDACTFMLRDMTALSTRGGNDSPLLL
jgi:hypothetical protein